MSEIYNTVSGYRVVGLGLAGVIALHVSSTFLLFLAAHITESCDHADNVQAYQFGLVAAARKTSGVNYPNMYATDAEAKADRKKHVSLHPSLYGMNSADAGRSSTALSVPVSADMHTQA